MALRSKGSTDDARLRTIKHLALQYDLEPEGDYARPDNSPPARAFQIINCAFDLAVEIARSGIPSTDRRAQKRGGKWMIENMHLQSGPDGVMLLAHALPTVLARTGGDLGGAIDRPTSSVEQHEKMLATVADFYPLTLDAQHLKDGLAEYAVIKDHEPRAVVAAGKEEGSAYSRALLRGEDPDQDPALVAEQKRWARDFYIGIAIRWACLRILGADYEKLATKMVTMAELREGRDEFRERLLDSWARGSRTYIEFVLLDQK